SSQMMARLLASQFGPKGVHVENSPGYHNFAIAHFARIRPSLFPSVESILSSVLDEARAAAPWFTLPDGSLAGFGDTSGTGEDLPAEASYDAESRGRWGDRILMRDLSAGGY